MDGAQASAAGKAGDWRDRLARLALVTTFSGLAFLNLVSIPHHLPVDSTQKLLAIAAVLSNVLFLSLIASTAITRFSPVRRAEGIEPRVSALAGTFLLTALAMFPPKDFGPLVSGLSSLLIAVGSLSSFLVLRWLGRSFSIMAEARRLVSDGPYRYVRHPLYLCEGLAIVGILIRVFSPWALAFAVVIALVQYRRMLNEEAVLRAAFPEDYAAYARRTPRLLPGIGLR